VFQLRIDCLSSDDRMNGAVPALSRIWRATPMRLAEAIPIGYHAARPDTMVTLRPPAHVLLVAALVVATRLPFLLHGTWFFDSDEAVEGLMARHVLQGEFPVFLWGQHYKGVPEVYLSAGVFGLFGSSVVALKATTLAIFAVYAGLHFRLLETFFSRRVAWIGSLLLMACPPALVLWSLSGNAEIVFTLTAGAILLLGVERWRTTGSRLGLVMASAATGFGLWVHQYLLFHLAALAIVAAARVPHGQTAFRDFLSARETSTGIRRLLHLLVAIGVVYAALGAYAFVAGGFEVSALGAVLSARHPQKLWRLACACLLGWAGLTWVVRQSSVQRATFARVMALPLAAFLVGYAPVLVHRATTGGRGPIARMDLNGLVASLPTVAYDIVPILLGFKSPGTARLPIAAGYALLVGAILVLSFEGIRRSGATRVFHIYLGCVAIGFLASGATIDAQSYRYLMPIYAALPAVYAVGIETAARWNRWAGTGLCGALVCLFAAQQITWYNRMEPDTESRAILSCVDARGVRHARAGYWLSYKLTFLANERLIVAPTDGVDRYPEYTRLVSASGQAPTIHRPLDPATADCDRVVAAGSRR
jgi:hypothetical protein